MSETGILRPNAAGDETAIASQSPATGEHWDKVDEAEADDAGTYVYTESGTYQRDLYHLDYTFRYGNITSVKVCFRCLRYDPGNATVKPCLKSGGTLTDGDEVVTTGTPQAWITYSQEWTTNPTTGLTWEWSELETLQIGISMKKPGTSAPICTQMYAEITYDPLTDYGSGTFTGVGTASLDGRSGKPGTGTLTGSGTVTCNGLNYLWLEQLKPTYKGLVRVVLTKAEEATLTYTNEDILIGVPYHIESDNNYEAQINLSNHDNTFTDLDLLGYQAAISWGARTDAGDLYSPSAPLTVIFQQLSSAGGNLLCSLRCISSINLLEEQAASESYLPDENNTDTLKVIAEGILGGVSYGFALFKAYTTSWDSEDDLIGSFVLADYFSVREGSFRLLKLNEILTYSKEVKRLENDGKIHFLNPTISGATYNYEYELGGTHTFYLKTYARTVKLPNYIAIQDATGTYLGSAIDEVDWAIRPNYRILELPITSDDDGNLIAAARLQKATVNSQSLSCKVRMNVFQRIWDYVKVTDSREGGSVRTGSVQYIERTWNRQKGELGMTIRMGGAGSLDEGNALALALNYAG